MAGSQPHLLVVTRGLATLRAHYEDVIATLIRSGVRVTVVYGSTNNLTEEQYGETLRRRGCAIELHRFPKEDRTRGDLLALRLRQLDNLLRFAHPDYHGREWLREVKFARSVPGVRRWATRLSRLGSGTALGAMRLATSLDRLLPAPEYARTLIAEEQPDLVAVVGIVWKPGLVDVVKAAAQARIPTAMWIQSWDNLTNKGLLHFTPDRVFVWNDYQCEELERYHGIPAKRGFVTGAQTFDHWFGGEPASTRTEFCSQNGIDPEHPIVLYLASSRQIEPPLEDFFLRWLEALHSSNDALLREATVLVRPHPTNPQAWTELDGRHPNLVISPTVNAAPINSDEYRRRFRNEIYHASAAVGLNTSAMIDAAIFGKPVCTVELADVPNRQRGTVHFGYLVTVGGGFLETATSFDEHTATLSELVRRDPYERTERGVRFIKEFVRPRGLDVTPADVFAEEMLRLVREPSDLPQPGRVGQAIGRLAYRAAFVSGAVFEDGPLRRAVRRMRRRVKKFERHHIRWRARTKPIRWFLFVWLRAGVRARIRRVRSWRTGRASPAE